MVQLMLTLSMAVGMAGGVVLDDPAKEMDALLESIEKDHFRGCLSVFSGGERVYFGTAGKADPKTGREFKKNMGLGSGSITKAFTKMAICQLVSKGKLSFNDPISRYLAGVPKDKEGILIRHLVNHTSGLDDLFGGDYELVGRDELVKTVLASKLVYPTGEDERYSNSGYSLLAVIVERVSGQSFEEFVADNQFEQIGLKRLGYKRGNWKTNELAVGTAPNGKRWGTALDHAWMKDGPSWNLRGNGGMIGTAEELYGWMKFVYDGKMKPAGVLDLFEPEFKDMPEGAVLMEAGGNNVFTTFIMFAPKLDLYVVGASCDGRFSMRSKERDILTAALKFRKK